MVETAGTPEPDWVSTMADEVIAAANDHELAMLFTGMRHFRH